MDRTQTLRIDCPICKTRGYIESSQGQEMCTRCEGSGLLEKEVPYKFETQGRWDLHEKAAEFGIEVDEASDSGHDDGNIKEE